jgi:SOS-response transcriptional repressor LexA
MGATTSQIEILDDIGHSAAPQELIRGKNVLVLKIKNDSFINEQFQDGDLILVEACSNGGK